MQPAENDSRSRISRGRGRILKRLPARAQNAERGGWGFAVEEAATNSIEELGDHGVSDGLGRCEIAELSRGFIGVEAGVGDEGVIFEQACDLAMFRFPGGVGNYMQQAAVRL